MNIDITIYCLTYNHVDYIRDALESFLMQRTSYKYNIFVYDDASTDGTSAVLQEYKEKYPEIFDIYISPRNIYRLPEREIIMHKLYEKHIIGKYVAWCEGDDYWTNPDKLQKQVEFLENNPRCSMVSHGAYWKDCRTGELKDYNPYNKNRYLTAEEVILQQGGNLSTASLVMRKSVFIRDINFPACDVGDIPMQLYALCKGDIYYFNCQMSMYRYMHDGSWSKEIDEDFENSNIHAYHMIDFLEKYNEYRCGLYEELIRRRCSRYLYSKVYEYQFMNPKEYCYRMQKLKRKLRHEEQKFIEKQMSIFNFFKGDYDLNDLEQINKFKYIVIMGTGNYSNYLTNFFLKNNIGYTGYVVSKKGNDNNKHFGKEVWEISGYPYSKADTLVIIGISQDSEKSVLEVLKKNDFNNILTPLWPYCKR